MGDTGKTCTACLPTGRQDPYDEPASVLLEKIRQEKERLIKEKKIKRVKNASIIYRGEDNSYFLFGTKLNYESCMAKPKLTQNEET